MSSPLILGPIGLGLLAVLLLLVARRRSRGGARSGRAGSTGAAVDLVSALVVELAVTPEAVKERRRTQPAPAPVAAPVAVTAPGPAAGSAPTPPASPGSTGTRGVPSTRRSPYASGQPGRHRIELPDDDAELDIHWRPQEQALGSAHGAPTPLARTTQISTTGRIEVGDGGDGGDVVTWQSHDDAW